MKRVKQLLTEWSSQTQYRSPQHSISVNLSHHDYARVRALCELYPDRSEEQVVSELLTALLDEVEESLPYIPGKKVVAEDEFGDPVYEDLGLTRQFEQLVKKYNHGG